MTRQIPEIAIKFLKKVEGVKLTAYQDSGGIWTIGVGHTGPEVIKGLKITSAKSTSYLRADLEIAAKRLSSVVKQSVIDELTDNQYAALLSFIFNLGVNKTWTIWKVLNKSDFDAVPAQLVRFVYVGKTKVNGLVNRRNEEVLLWSKDEPGSQDEPVRFIANLDTPPAAVKTSKTTVGAMVLAGTSAVGSAVQPVMSAVQPFGGMSQYVDTIITVLATLAACAAGIAAFVMWKRSKK